MGSKDIPPEFVDRVIGPVTVLFGAKGGKYPHGNSLLVCGTNETVVIDPSLGIVERNGPAPPADRVLLSHCHEDHVAGAHLYADRPWHFHEADLPGIQSLDAFMAIYGFPPEVEAGFRRVALEEFHFTPRTDALSYQDADVFDLGDVRIQVLHTPGHTRGHSCFQVEWGNGSESLLYLGDIDLSSFGPYYGDAWSNLEDFERSLARVREVEANFYATFHHIGVLDSRDAFLERLDRYAAVIDRREIRLLEFLAEAPRTLQEVAAHRFVYRPGDAVLFAEPVERRSMGMHIERLVRAGRVEELEDDLFRAR
jgi:glyoxylase-like metal-dependent hydrolase (beta-lactamase superfamily II)